MKQNSNKAKPTTAVFVDVQNIYYTTKQIFGRNFDYNALWAEIRKDHIIKTACAYAINRGDDKQRQFQNILRGIGFEVKLKPFIQRSDGTAKGDWDVGITIDIMEVYPSVDSIILLSGDGDFDLLLQKITQNEKKAYVYGVDALSAESLISSATKFRPIDDSLLLYTRQPHL